MTCLLAKEYKASLAANFCFDQSLHLMNNVPEYRAREGIAC